jgi:phosphopantetheine adenylyltransferase
MKSNNLKIRILYFISIFLVLTNIFTAKKNLSQTKDLKQTVSVLDSLVQKYYLLAKKNDIYGIRDRVDSIYNDGNKLLENYNNSSFEEFCVDFLNEYGKKNIIMNKRNNYNYTAIQTKLIQMQYLIDVIQYEYESFFQVDLISADAVNSVVKQNETGRLKLFIIHDFYLNFEKQPPYKVVIDGDTLCYNRPYYYYDYFGEEKGEYFINADIIGEKWGMTRNYPVSFKVVVE